MSAPVLLTPAASCGVSAIPSTQSTRRVYEFSVALGAGGKKLVVYVGESTDLHRRHHSDYRGPSGSHIKECFENALKARRAVAALAARVGSSRAFLSSARRHPSSSPSAPPSRERVRMRAPYPHRRAHVSCPQNDLTVWRRLRYTASKDEAVKWESFCLGQFDYAWNKKLNDKKEARRRAAQLANLWALRRCRACRLGASEGDEAWRAAAKRATALPPRFAAALGWGGEPVHVLLPQDRHRPELQATGGARALASAVPSHPSLQPSGSALGGGSVMAQSFFSTQPGLMNPGTCMAGVLVPGMTTPLVPGVYSAERDTTGHKNIVLFHLPRLDSSGPGQVWASRLPAPVAAAVRGVVFLASRATRAQRTWGRSGVVRRPDLGSPEPWRPKRRPARRPAREEGTRSFSAPAAIHP